MRQAECLNLKNRRDSRKIFNAEPMSAVGRQRRIAVRQITSAIAGIAVTIRSGDFDGFRPTEVAGLAFKDEAIPAVSRVARPLK